MYMRRQRQWHQQQQHQQHTKMEITIHTAIERHRFSRKLNGNKVGRGKTFCATHIDPKQRLFNQKRKIEKFI